VCLNGCVFMAGKKEEEARAGRVFMARPACCERQPVACLYGEAMAGKKENPPGKPGGSDGRAGNARRAVLNKRGFNRPSPQIEVYPAQSEDLVSQFCGCRSRANLSSKTPGCHPGARDRVPPLTRGIARLPVSP